MNIDHRFASSAESVDEMPEPFRQALRDRLGPDEPISFLTYAPAFASAGEKSPATVLAVTDRRWLVVAEEEDGSAEVAGCAFDETLLVEMTTILLYGRLKIEFATNGVTQSSSVQFNTVMGSLYHKGLQLLLDGIESVSSQATDSAITCATPSMSVWPIKFRNDVLNSVPKGRTLILATHWPALISGFRREMAPAAALALTERELILVAEEKAWNWLEPQQHQKNGRIVTYFPLARLAKHGISRHGQFNILELETYAGHGGEKLQIIFPSQHEAGVAELLQKTTALALN